MRNILLTALIVLLTCTVVNASDFVFSFGFGYGSPVVYTQPYVYAPEPVVYAPAPVIYTAPPVIYRPYVYTAPIYRHPVIVHSPAPRHYGPIFGHRPDVRPHGPIFNRPSPRGPMHQFRGSNGPSSHGNGPKR